MWKPLITLSCYLLLLHCLMKLIVLVRLANCGFLFPFVFHYHRKIYSKSLETVCDIYVSTRSFLLVASVTFQSFLPCCSYDFNIRYKSIFLCINIYMVPGTRYAPEIQFSEMSFCLCVLWSARGEQWILVSRYRK